MTPRQEKQIEDVRNELGATYIDMIQWFKQKMEDVTKTEVSDLKEPVKVKINQIPTATLTVADDKLSREDLRDEPIS